MILVDTSVWIDHLRIGDRQLESLLDNIRVLTHPFVIGEIACGNLVDRNRIISLLEDLPQAPIATQKEILIFIEKHQLMGQGIGYVDVHLLAATALAGTSQIWSQDKRLTRVAVGMNLAYEPIS